MTEYGKYFKKIQDQLSDLKAENYELKVLVAKLYVELDARLPKKTESLRDIKIDEHSVQPRGGKRLPSKRLSIVYNGYNL